MKIKLNGDFKKIDTDQKSLNLSLVIKKLNLNPKLIVVEFNGLIINKKLWEDTIVREGAVLEIVTIVGGGS